MKLISAIVLAFSIAAPALASDFTDLQNLNAAGISKVNPFPNPSNPDSCYLTGLNDGLCSFKCRSGETFQVNPVKPQAVSVYEKCGGGDYRGAQPPDAGAILAQINQQNNIPQPILSPDLQFALEAASSLRGDLKSYGVKAKVGLLNEPGGRYGLWVEFKNWADYEKIKDLFYQDPGENPSYMDLKVYPRVPKEAAKADLSWKNIRLQAADGTRLTIDYSPLSLGGEIIAAPLWVTVSAPRFSGSEKVRAVIMTYYDSSNIAANTLKETQSLDLKFNGQAFQAEGGRVQLSESHIGYGYNFRQEIAVVVDGQWLTDPANGTHNFKFKMGW